MTTRRLFDVLNIALVALIAVAFVFFEKLSNTMLLGGFVVGFALAAVIVWMAVKRVAAHGCAGTPAETATNHEPA
jgi:lipopolysaccharide export LptBFGC system permease protein LptF